MGDIFDSIICSNILDYKRAKITNIGNEYHDETMKNVKQALVNKYAQTLSVCLKPES